MKGQSGNATDIAGSASRETILDAAERLFARQGFAATPVKQIAGTAGVNVALLYYYYRDKDGLYHAVLARSLATFAARMASAFAASSSTVEEVGALIRLQAQTLAANPDLARLLARALLDYAAVHTHPQLADLVAAHVQRLSDAIARGQREGVFRPDIDPRLAAISSIMQMAHLAMAPSAVPLFLGNAHADERAAPMFADHAAAFAIAALESHRARADSQADGA